MRIFASADKLCRAKKYLIVKSCNGLNVEFPAFFLILCNKITVFFLKFVKWCDLYF